MTELSPLCMDPPKRGLKISLRPIGGIIFVLIILFVLLIPPPSPTPEKVAFLISTIEEHLEVDYIIETKDKGFAFVVAERPFYRDGMVTKNKTGGIACFIRTDKDGVILWNITLPINEREQYVPDFGYPCLPIHYIQETTNGDFLVSCYSSKDPLLFLISNAGEILKKFDSIIDLEPWYSYLNETAVIPTANSGLRGRLTNILETSDGKFIIAGAIIKYDGWMGVTGVRWIKKIDTQGNVEWSWINTSKADFHSWWLSSTNELFLYSTEVSGEGSREFLLKCSPEGVVEWNKSLDHHVGPRFERTVLYTPTGFLIQNNTQLLKINFDGEIEWTKEYLDFPGDIDGTKFLVTEEEGFFAVNYGHEWMGPEANYCVKMFNVSKYSPSGDHIWHKEIEYNEYKLWSFCNEKIFLTSMGVVIAGKNIILVHNDETISSTDFNSLEFQYNYYQISDNQFIYLKRTELGDCWVDDYLDVTLDISCFNSSGSLLWPKNFTCSFKAPIVGGGDIPGITILAKTTSDNGVVIIGSEYNTTATEYPILLLKINKQGTHWINRYTFTSIDPLNVTVTKGIELDGKTDYNTSWSFPIILYGLFVVVVVVRKKYL